MFATPMQTADRIKCTVVMILSLFKDSDNHINHLFTVINSSDEKGFFWTIKEKRCTRNIL